MSLICFRCSVTVAPVHILYVTSSRFLLSRAVTRQRHCQIRFLLMPGLARRGGEKLFPSSNEKTKMAAVAIRSQNRLAHSSIIRVLVIVINYMCSFEQFERRPSPPPTHFKRSSSSSSRVSTVEFGTKNALACSCTA